VIHGNRLAVQADQNLDGMSFRDSINDWVAAFMIVF
jgi:hypothetical protein